MQKKGPGFANLWRLAGMAAASIAALGILGFYAGRLWMPLPIFAADEGAYLIRALYVPALADRNPGVAGVNNGIPLSLIRILYNTGEHYIVWHRIADAAAYLAGLLALWAWTTRGLARSGRLALLLIAIGFNYYRFAFSNLPEGLFVGVMALMGVATAWLYRTRPVAHALLLGVLGAVLVLTKPHGVALIAALGAVAVAESLFSRRFGLLALRAALFAAVFFAAGNLIQHQAHEPVTHPLMFFVGDFYGGQLAGELAPAAGWFGGLALGSMVSAMAVLAGIPLVVGLCDLLRRWRADRAAFRLGDDDLVFLLFVAATAATLPMAAIFAMKIAGVPGESGRLWGRYFEFLAPLIWLAAAPALARYDGARDQGPRLAAAGVVLAGLAGLMLSFRAGIVLFPWDASVLTAFFEPDPARAPLSGLAPFRGLAILATLLAVGAMVLKARPTWVGVGHLLALGVLSAALDHVWVGPTIEIRNALERDARAILPKLPRTAGVTVLLASDANHGHLGFLRLNAKPRVLIGPPAKTPARALMDAEAVVVSGPDLPPGGVWVPAYEGRELSLYRR